MPRKGPAPRRPLVDDPVYGSKGGQQARSRYGAKKEKK